MERIQEKNNHLILTGDFIHSCYEEDGSLEIINSVKQHFENEKNFHVLLGNHEWAQILDESIYKGGLNQTQDFKTLFTKNMEMIQIRNWNPIKNSLKHWP